MNIFLLIVFISTFLFGLICSVYLKKLPLRKHVCVVILGDIGRSPRMQYHARSFAHEGFKVDVIGYPGSVPIKELLENENVKIYYLKQLADLSHIFDAMAIYVLKVLHQSYYLFKTLISNPRPSYLILQNPPAIPTIPVCWLYCFVMRVKFIIDWHNYAFTIMGLTLGENHPIVKIALLIETYFGSKAAINFCVTEALKTDLHERWNIKASVLYDRSQNNFHPINLEEKHNLLIKLSNRYEVLKGINSESSAITTILDGKIVYQKPRPALLVSSTSWTEDEDFYVLIKALDDYESAYINKNEKLPKLICIITGKGPLKDFYIRLIESRKWKHITAITPWLEMEDYPKLLATADLGVCLHKSSSGLDLPMKVVDMFGCGLPVLAHNFNCLHELVRHNENSFIFSNETELSNQIKSWFKEFPNNSEQIKKSDSIKAQLNEFQKVRWHDNWKTHVLPFVNK